MDVTPFLLVALLVFLERRDIAEWLRGLGR